MRNVMSWKGVLDAGFHPSLYPYDGASIIAGNYLVQLDFKIWAKRANGIECYFTEPESGRRLQVTVYRRDDDHVYAVKNSDLDIAEYQLSRRIQLLVRIGKAGVHI